MEAESCFHGEEWHPRNCTQLWGLLLRHLDYCHEEEREEIGPVCIVLQTSLLDDRILSNQNAMDYSLLWANRVLISIFHLLLNWNRNHWARGPLRMVSWGSRTLLSALPPWLKETGSQKHSIGCPLSALFTPPSSPKAHTEHRQGFESNLVLTSIRIGNEAWNSTAISNSSSPWPVSGNRVDHSTCCFTCDNDSWASAEAEASFDLFITLSDLEPNSHNDCRWLLGSRTLSGLLLGGILKHLFAMVSPLLRQELT